MMMLGQKDGGGHAPIPLTEDGKAVKLAAATATKTKPLEATASSGNATLSALTWVGGTLENPTSVYVEAPSGNAAAVKLGAVGGSGGVSVEPGLSVTIDFPDPTLWEIRVGAGDSAKLTATEPATL